MKNQNCCSQNCWTGLHILPFFHFLLGNRIWQYQVAFSIEENLRNIMLLSFLAMKVLVVHIFLSNVPCPKVQLVEKYRTKNTPDAIRMLYIVKLTKPVGFKPFFDIINRKKYILYPDSVYVYTNTHTHSYIDKHIHIHKYPF